MMIVAFDVFNTFVLVGVDLDYGEVWTRWMEYLLCVWYWGDIILQERQRKGKIMKKIKKLEKIKREIDKLKKRKGKRKEKERKEKKRKSMTGTTNTM